MSHPPGESHIRPVRQTRQREMWRQPDDEDKPCTQTRASAASRLRRVFRPLAALERTLVEHLAGSGASPRR